MIVIQANKPTEDDERTTARAGCATVHPCPEGQAIGEMSEEEWGAFLESLDLLVNESIAFDVPIEDLIRDDLLGPKPRAGGVKRCLSQR